MAIDETGEAVETEEEARTLLRSEIGEEKNASVTGHLYGKDQIHRHVDRVDHYRFSSRPDDGSSIVGWVVTADGTIYQVVQGAC